jgi:hypothetical protein
MKKKRKKLNYTTLAVRTDDLGDVWGEVGAYCRRHKPKILLKDWLVKAIKRYAKELSIIKEDKCS